MNAEYENVLDDHPGKLHFMFANTWNQLLPAHWHEHLEIVYVTGGEITAAINDVSYELKKGDIFLVNSNDIHYTYTHENTRYFLLQIPPIHLERVSARWKTLKFQEFIPGDRSINEHSPEKAGGFFQEPKPEECQKLIPEEFEDGEENRNMARASLNSQMAEIFHQIDGLYQEKREGYHLLVLAAVYRLLFLLYTEGIRTEEETSGSHGTLRDLERMKLCMEYVQVHYGENISLADAAGLLSITPEHFCRLFHKYTGQTFLAYVNQIRMEHFYNDLLETNENITFLLDKNGITNYKGFLLKFKDRYGQPPKAVRRKNRAL